MCPGRVPGGLRTLPPDSPIPLPDPHTVAAVSIVMVDGYYADVAPSAQAPAPKGRWRARVGTGGPGCRKR